MTDTARIFEDALAAALDGWDMPIEPEAMARLRRHYEAMVEANRTMNLTRITDPVEAAVKHYADSLALAHWAQSQGATVRRVLDIGTGAGFPAVPLAVVRTDWDVTAIDSTAKKVRFVESAAEELNLTNLHCKHAHAAHFKPARSFDVVTFRALTTLAKALPDAARHLARGGRLIAYKTPSVEGELKAAAGELRPAKLRVGQRFAYQLAFGEETLERVLVMIQKG